MTIRFIRERDGFALAEYRLDSNPVVPREGETVIFNHRSYVVIGLRWTFEPEGWLAAELTIMVKERN